MLNLKSGYRIMRKHLLVAASAVVLVSAASLATPALAQNVTLGAGAGGATAGSNNVAVGIDAGRT